MSASQSVAPVGRIGRVEGRLTFYRPNSRGKATWTLTANSVWPRRRGRHGCGGREFLAACGFQKAAGSSSGQYIGAWPAGALAHDPAPSYGDHPPPLAPPLRSRIFVARRRRPGQMPEQEECPAFTRLNFLRRPIGDPSSPAVQAQESMGPTLKETDWSGEPLAFQAASGPRLPALPLHPPAQVDHDQQPGGQTGQRDAPWCPNRPCRRPAPGWGVPLVGCSQDHLDQLHARPWRPKTTRRRIILVDVRGRTIAVGHGRRSRSSRLTALA